MSLFGSSPDESSLSKPTQSSKPTLFGDEQAAGAVSNSSLFDDRNGNGDSPWSLPTPKKSGRGDLVKTLLPASDVPESYTDAYDILLESGYGAEAGSISLSGVKEMFEGCGLDGDEKNKILSIVAGGHEPSGNLTRGQFNVLLALIGLSQEKEDATLDGVDERRKSELYHCCWLHSFSH